jgi:predicted nuclease with RNAse H fold
MMMKEWWPSMTWFGADPGGADNFGVAVLREDGTYNTQCVNCADEAITWIREFGRPNGVGIDCPLWWSSGRGGGRKVDQWLRDQGIPPGTVQAPNSLQGAVLVQGIMFAVRLRERYQGVLITEAHPKALLRFLGLSRELDKWDEVQKGFNLKGSVPSEHERDAVLAAVAAREGMTGVWSRDLSISRYESEVDPKRMWFGEVSYFWPYKAVAARVKASMMHVMPDNGGQLNQAALQCLREADAPASPYNLYLLELALWGLEKGVPVECPYRTERRWRCRWAICAGGSRRTSWAGWWTTRTAPRTRWSRRTTC